MRLLRGVLKTYGGDSEVWFFSVDGFWCRWGGVRTQLSTGSLTKLLWVYGKHKLDLVCFCSLFGDRAQGGRVALGGAGSKCNRNAFYEIPK